MQHDILVLANKNGGNFSTKKIKAIENILALGEGKLRFRVVVTESLLRLEEVIKEYKGGGITLAAIVGGDGTMLQTRTLIENEWGYSPLYAFYAEGTKNNIQRSLGIGPNSSLALTKHIVDAACTDTLELYTFKVPSLDINGWKGFNVGFGLISRLLWFYYGKSARAYYEMEEALQSCDEEQYQAIYKKFAGKEANGKWGVAKSVLQLLKGLKSGTEESYLLQKRIIGEIKFDGEKQQFPQTPIGVYASCYEEVNLGWGRFNPKPSPEANKEEGKFQAVVAYGNPFSIIPQLPKVIAGEKMSNALYQSLSTLEVPAEKVVEIDGEHIPINKAKVSYDGTRRVVTLPVTV
ncbi:hypothetical protein HYV87_04895 [Candidatus Woesearchaeota archaeon]|nr:hypothetical protein [Candidatus Woesearchaeota archaeon]